eukprot:3232396-Amphidinium_carterae.1
MYGRVGRAATGPLRQRQYVDRAPWKLSHALRRSFDFFETLLMTLQPKRVVSLRAPVQQFIIV